MAKKQIRETKGPGVNGAISSVFSRILKSIIRSYMLTFRKGYIKIW